MNYLLHTLISCVALISGILVVKGMVVSAGRQLWTSLFLVSAAATTLTGFLVPFAGVTLALVLNAVSIIPITLAFVARYRFRLKGAWRGTYAISVVAALYLIVYALIAQHAPHSVVAHLGSFVVFIALGFFSLKNFRPKIQDEIPSTYISPKPDLE